MWFKRLSIYFNIVLVVSCGILFGELNVKSFTKLTLTDFHVYYYIPRAVISDTSPTHPYSNYTPIYPYFFPPASIVLLRPLSEIPFYLAKIIWTILNTIALIVSIALINKVVANKFMSTSFWCMLFLSLVFYPVRFTFMDGQFNIFMLLFYSVCFYTLIKNSHLVLGGVALGLGVFTKISPALIGLYALYKRHFKVIFIAGLITLFFTALAEFYIKPGINLYYLKHVVSKVSDQSSGAGWADQSPLVLIKRLSPPTTPGYIKSLIVYGFVGIILFIFWVLEKRSFKSKVNEQINYSLLTLIGVLGTGLSWFHQFSILLLPLLSTGLLCYYNLARHKIKFLILIPVVFILWMFNMKNRLIGLWELNMLWGALILLIILLVLKANQIWFEEKIQEEIPTIDNKYLIIIFGFAFIMGLSPWNLKNNLEESRDYARINNLNYTSEVLNTDQLSYKIGREDSISKINLTDRGYLLIDKKSIPTVISDLAILYIDPINQGPHKYTFESADGIIYKLSAKLESEKYISKYGDSYEVSNLNMNK